MAILSIANLVLSIGDRVLLNGANLTLDANEHVAMVGRNGTGKSTFLRVITGDAEAQAHVVGGHVQLQRGSTVGYLPQDPDLVEAHTLRDEAAGAFVELTKLHDRLHSVSQRMTDAAGVELDKLMRQYERLEHDVESGGGYAIDHRIDATLHGLGLTDDLFGVKVADLSGGQRGRLALAKLLLAEPDLLLLDEPTNHLDIAGRQWLEQFLEQYRGAVIIVSHDRWLLNRVASRIYELEAGRFINYPGNYSQYRQLRAERSLAQHRAHGKQQQAIKREQQFIERYRAGQRARQARGREKRLQRYIRDEMVDRPVELDEVNIKMNPIERSGDIVARADQLSKSYGDRRLFDSVNLIIRRGDRIGIIGPNGAGKSTLARCLIGRDFASSGVARLGARVNVGWYRQSHEHLSLDQSVVQYLQQYVCNGTDQQARDLAGAFLFSGPDQDRPLGELSGGERSRAVLAGLIAGGHNLLVLDEPTNHLDIPSVERLEEALRRGATSQAEKEGRITTLILITHDRMLLNDLVDQLLILDGQGGVLHFLGSFADYERAQSRHNDPTKPSRQQTETSRKVKRNTAKTQSRGNALTKLSQESLDQQIMDIETELAEIDRQLADPAAYGDGQRIKALQQRRGELADKLFPLEAEWSRRAEPSSE